jgi:hypothetical protein
MDIATKVFRVCGAMAGKSTVRRTLTTLEKIGINSADKRNIINEMHGVFDMQKTNGTTMICSIFNRIKKIGANVPDIPSGVPANIDNIATALQFSSMASDSAAHYINSYHKAKNIFIQRGLQSHKKVLESTSEGSFAFMKNPSKMAEKIAFTQNPISNIFQKGLSLISA